MSSNKLIIPIGKKRIPFQAGNKALSLQWLVKNNFSIPTTHVCQWSAYQQFLDHRPGLLNDVRLELERLIDPQKKYAVRSSANIEDGNQMSFAGQFKSVLNVIGVDGVLDALLAVWQSTSASNVEIYLHQCNIQPSDLKMAVIIQEMVNSRVSGVALSRNPVNGADEVIVEAVQGTGEALVQEGVSPIRWVNRWGAWTTIPEKDFIPLSIIETIVNQTRKISRAQKKHVDLEWAWDGKQIYWLQVRPITALHNRNIYSNTMSKEMLPGMIKPLIWSINIPMKTGVFLRFMEEILGDTGIDPGEMVKSFYYRVYFNMGVIGEAFNRMGLPAESVEMMSGFVPMQGKMMRPTLRMFIHLPRVMKLGHRLWRFHKTMQEKLPELEERINAISWQSDTLQDAKTLLEASSSLYDLVQEVTYYNILCPILSVMHTRMFNRQLNKLGIEISQLDISTGQPDVEEFNPDIHLERLHFAYEELEPNDKETIRMRGLAGLQEKVGKAGQFYKSVDAFIKKFGHLSENGNDFSVAPWRETPVMVMDMIINYQPAQEKRASKIQFSDIKIPLIRRPMMRIFFDRVRQYHGLRERLSSHYTYTYGLFRSYYLAMGNHLVKRGLIDSSIDVFYLPAKSVRMLIDGDQAPVDLRAEINLHKAAMKQFEQVSLPTIIYGDEQPFIADQSNKCLYGLATSLGQYTGPVRVIHSLDEFKKIQQGDVLVIPYSDVGWAPLFTRAGAVVSESGGLLSHSSIIAREYGIPAVVSVNGAMKLSDDMLVTVNGHRGEVVLLTPG